MKCLFLLVVLPPWLNRNNYLKKQKIYLLKRKQSKIYDTFYVREVISIQEVYKYYINGLK